MAATEPADFTMHGARAAMASGLSHIGTQINALEQAVIENPGLAFDLARSVVESACKTILSDKKIPFAKTDPAPKLFKLAIGCTPLLPSELANAEKAERSLEATLSGLNTALQGVCELRNECGFASHGSDGRRPVLEYAQALLAAQTADTIIGFLHRMHNQGSATKKLSVEYSDNQAFNDNIDETHEPIRILALEYRPSEVLFKVDASAYQDALNTFKAGEALGERDE